MASSPRVPQPISSDHVGWLAGLFEGEGSIGIRRRPHRRVQIVATVAMTDLDVLERVLEWSGLGFIRGPYRTTSKPNSPNWKPLWVWTISKSSDSVRFLEEVMPLFLVRRHARAEEAIAAYYAEHTPAVLAQRLAWVERRDAGLCAHCGVNPYPRPWAWCPACTKAARVANAVRKAG
jgi:hypothetical protein